MPTRRASLEDTLAFANKVREAGGGNPLQALMPGIPEEPSACLLAANLNFDCEVSYYAFKRKNGTHYDAWGMSVENSEIGKVIASKLGLVGCERVYSFQIKLPAAIGQVAEDFDEAHSILTRIRNDATDFEETRNAFSPSLSRAERKLVNEMLPYIDEAQREAYGDIVRDGKLTI